MDLDIFQDETLRQHLESAVGEFVPGPTFARAPRPNWQKKRFPEVLNNFCDEPLPWYKKLEHTRPQWPSAMRKFTAKEGFRVADTHNIEVSTRDQLQRTKKGSMRTSTGVVTYDARDRMAFEIDVEDIARILREREPHMQHGRLWSVKKLEKAHQNQCRQHGSWKRQGVSFKVFLCLFPRTFDLFGADHEFVRLCNKSRLRTVDDSEHAMISLALGCERGYVGHTAPLEGTMKAEQNLPRIFPELAHVRTKTMFRSSSDPGLSSHTLPAIKANRTALDVTFKLPFLAKASTLPVLEPPAERTASASTVHISDMHDTKSTFRVSFAADREGSRLATPALVDL